ncbi:MAG: dUTP diphosphatase [Victivallales bacterium]|nr:dUTP diphosphatase [Victivallales bacterium]
MSIDGNIVVKIKMKEGCDDLIPQKAHHDDAAFDLKSREEVLLEPGKSHLVPTGLFIELPLHYEAQIRPRSGLALKHTLTVANSPGTVDAGYRGEVCVIMLNAGTENYTVKRGERIAQMVINKLPQVGLIKVKELSITKRGKGGFGSTGNN